MRAKRRAPLQGDFLTNGAPAKASPTISTSTTSAYYTPPIPNGLQSDQPDSKPIPQAQPVSTQILNIHPFTALELTTQPLSTNPRTLRPNSINGSSSRMHILQMDIKEYLNKSAGVVDKIRHGNPNSHPFRIIPENDNNNNNNSTARQGQTAPSDGTSSSSGLAAKRGFWRRQDSAFVTSAMPAPERRPQSMIRNSNESVPLNDQLIKSENDSYEKNHLIGGDENVTEVATEVLAEDSFKKIRRTGSVRLRLKRFSVESVEQTARTFNRLSLSNIKLRRTSMHKAPTPHLNDLSLISSHRNTGNSTNPQPYWKYHVIGFGNGLILATNPSTTQDGCRTGPGYHVEVKYNDRSNLSTGFKLTFRRLIYANDETQTPVLTIIRKSDAEGGYFTVSVRRSSVLNSKTGLIDYHNDDHLYRDFSIGENYRPHEQKLNKSIFNGLVFPKGIPNKFMISSSQNLVDQQAEGTLPTAFKNYEFKDFNNIKWSVGSIPRVKLSKLPRLREKAFVPQYKYVNPNYSYFHQNYIEEEDPQDHSQDDDNESIMTMTSKTTLSSTVNSRNQYKYKELKNPQNIYFQGAKGEAEFPPVLAVFRPKEKSYKRKQILKSIHRKFQSPMYAHERGSSITIDSSSIYGDIDIGNDDFDTQSLRTLRSSIYEGDGLYHDDPNDDEPQNTKYGWITVYEDKDIFCKSKGMFDVVVGLTFAAGFEKLAGVYNV